MDLAGLNFVGLLNDDGRPSERTYIERPCSAISYILTSVEYDVEYQARSSPASNILDNILLGSGVTGSVVGEDRTLIGYAFKGKASEAIADLAAKGKYLLFYGPNSVKLIDRLDPPTMDTVDYDNPFGFDKIDKKFSSVRPVNEIVVRGGVPKTSDDEDDSESRTLPFTGDGRNPWFSVPNVTDRITAIRVDGTNKTVCYVGDPDQATFDCVFYPKEY